MDKDFVLIYSALIAVSGVILSAGINLWINNVNRDKSRNEWKRDKLLELTNEFVGFSIKILSMPKLMGMKAG